MSDEQSVEGLRASMRAEADRRRDEIVTAADEQVAQIRKRAEQTIEAQSREAHAALDRELETVTRRFRDEAELTRRRRMLEVANVVLDEAFLAATDKLADPERNSAYRPRLAALAADAALAVANRTDGDATIVLKCSRELSSDAKAAVERAGVRVTIEDAPAGTLLATTSDGSRSVDNGVATRLERSRVRLLPSLAKVLFSDEKGA